MSETKPDTAPLSRETASRSLGDLIAHRPDTKDLTDRNIIRGPQNVAPALQQQALDLERARVVDSLTKGIERRRSMEALVEQNILKEPAARGVAPSLQSVQGQLEKKFVEDKLESSLQKRPSQSELVQQHILPDVDPKLDPSLVSNLLAFEKAKLEDHLSHSLKERPKKEDLVGYNILKEECGIASTLQGPAADLKRHMIADQVEQNVKGKADELRNKGVIAGA